MTVTSKEAVERLALFGTEGGAFMAPATDGRYVRATDYDALAQRCADLEAENGAYKEWATDVKRFTRQIDVEMRGGGAAIQASLCDLVGAGLALRARAERAEAERDAIAVAMVEAAANVLDTHGDSAATEALGQRLCCNGQMCGCRGASVGDYLQHLIRALTPADALAKLAAIRAEERAATWRAAADICRVSPQEQAAGDWGPSGMEMARVLRSAILAAMEKEQGE